MKKDEIKIGGHYLAKVAGNITTVRVDAIRDKPYPGARVQQLYDVTNLKTGRKTTFRSAAKFRAPAKGPTPASVRHKGGDESDPLAPAEFEVKGTVHKGGLECGEAKLTKVEAEQRPDPTKESTAAATTRPAASATEPESTPQARCPRCGSTVAIIAGCYDYHPRPNGLTCGMSGERVRQEGENSSDPPSSGTGSAASPANTEPPAWQGYRDGTPFLGGAAKAGAAATDIEDALDSGTLDWDWNDDLSAATATHNGSKYEIRRTAKKEDKQSSDPTPIAAATAVVLSGPPYATASSVGPATTPRADGTTEETNKLAAGIFAGKTSLASRIATTRVTTRRRGEPVAGLVPNEEQEAIIEAAMALQAQRTGLRVLVVGAGAGTGKTATERILEQILEGKGQYTAFNASIVADSKDKFVKAACNTTHSLAFRAVGKKYQHRLRGEAMRSQQIARVLGIEDMTVVVKGGGEPDEQGRPTDREKRLHSDFLAGQVIVAVKKFCQGAERSIGPEHFRHIVGIDTDDRTNNTKVREYLLPFAQKAWDDICSVNGRLQFVHDYYVKMWQLGEGHDRPVIAADYIMLDEAQDTAPVMLDVLKQQTHALLIMVGDDNQQIYEWRGAVNAMTSFPGAPRRLLSQSYRFGQAVADVANTVLATLDEPTDLVMRGLPSIPSRVARVVEPRCYLYRTNAGAVGRVMSAAAAGKRPHLIGKADDVVGWCEAALDLQAGRGTRHPELACFETWDEVVKYSKTDEGAEMRLMVKLINDFGAAKIRAALKNMPKEEDADFVVSTAHKSKGREWDTVYLGPDFPTANKMGDADRRLLYVAVTRAKLTLDITECPPFCGGYDRADTGDPENNGWIPGLPIKWTREMPSEEEQAEWVAVRAEARPAPTPPAPSPTAAVPAAPPPRTTPTTPTPGYRWTTHDGRWCIRGPVDPEFACEKRVMVPSKKDGVKEIILYSVLRKDGDTWLYGVDP